MSDRIPLGGSGWLRLSEPEKDTVGLFIRNFLHPFFIPSDLDGRYGKLFAIDARYLQQTLIGEGELFVKDGCIGLVSSTGESGLKVREIEGLEKEMIELWFAPITRRSREK